MAAAAATGLKPPARRLDRQSCPGSRRRDFEAIQGSHPVPGASEARRPAGACARDPVSAGESAPAPPVGRRVPSWPCRRGITLDDKRRTTDRLLQAGGHLRAQHRAQSTSRLSGRRPRGRRAGVSFQALAISDVVGDDLSVIASGPGVPDGSRFEDAIAVLRRFGGLDAYPPRRGRAPWPAPATSAGTPNQATRACRARPRA
jgi:hydroxypyruvate reductase